MTYKDIQTVRTDRLKRNALVEFFLIFEEKEV